MLPFGIWFLLSLSNWSVHCTISATAHVVTVISTSTATALSDCTCTQTLSRHLTRYESFTTSTGLEASPSALTPGTSLIDIETVSEKSAGPTLSGISGKETSLASTDFTLSICPTRITNPTYTPPSPLPTDYTWGCPPHHLCQPDRHTQNGECNFEAGPPADTYYCAPEQCIPSPPLLPPQFWGQPVLSDQVGQFKVSPGYFNLNPHEFGLDYSIFRFLEPSKNKKRELSVRIPGKCYDECNDAMLEAESKGKTSDLCESDSAFLTLVRSCQSCVGSVDLSRTSVNTLPQFQQFLYYCKKTYRLSSPASNSSTPTLLTSTALHSVKSTSTALALSSSKAVPSTTVSSTRVSTTAELTTTAPYTAAVNHGSVLSSITTIGTSTIGHLVETSTRESTGASTSNQKEWPPSSSPIVIPTLTSDGSFPHSTWSLCFFPVLFGVFLCT